MWFIRKKEKSISFLFPPLLSFSYDSCNTQNLNRFTSYIASTSSLNYQCPLSKNKNCYSYLEWWVKYYINLHTPPAAGYFIIDITVSPLHIYNFTCLLCRRRKKYRNWLKPFFSLIHIYCSVLCFSVDWNSASLLLSFWVTTLQLSRKPRCFSTQLLHRLKWMRKKKEKNRPNWTNERRCKQIQQETSMNIRRDITIVKWKEMKDIRQPNSIMFGRGTSLSALYRFFQISLVDRTPLMAGDDDQRFSDISSILAVKLSQH